MGEMKTLREALKEFHNAPVTRPGLLERCYPQNAKGFEWKPECQAWVKHSEVNPWAR